LFIVTCLTQAIYTAVLAENVVANRAFFQAGRAKLAAAGGTLADAVGAEVIPASIAGERATVAKRVIAVMAVVAVVVADRCAAVCTWDAVPVI
jgi:hypothetical protein